MTIRWTPEQDAELRAAYGTEFNTTLAKRVGRSVDAVKQRAFSLGLTNPWDDAECDRDRRRQDQRFVAAMCAAIRAGTERPDRVGIHRAEGRV